jgi:acetylornithine/N-succinyldiaminopimelate aminotransferase
METAMDNIEKIIADDKEFLFQNYGDRLPVSFTHGKGEYLFDQDGTRYIDFFSGIAVSALGHSHPEISKRLHAQVDRIIHSSNWYYNTEQIEASKLISDFAFKGKTLFVNSGAEANEAAIKLARRFGKVQSNDKSEIISFLTSFHGRTYGSMSATGNEKIRTGFDPLVPGFTHLPFNDCETFIKRISSGKVCGVLIELIQGEGGINIADKKFVQTIASECKKHNALFIIDEVQTGMGRTGKPFAFLHYDVNPDIITLAKGLGGGVAIGALHARSDLASHLPSGAHGTTFGGNHLACAAACAVLKVLMNGDIIEKANQSSKIFFDRLNQIKQKAPVIREIRGIGLHIGVEINKTGYEIVKKALKKKLLINCTHDTVLRIMPPLTISQEAIIEGLEIFESIITEE